MDGTKTYTYCCSAAVAPYCSGFTGMSDLAFIIFLGIVVWLAAELSDGGGGSRQKLRLPC